jgi:hypothetical protein
MERLEYIGAVKLRQLRGEIASLLKRIDSLLAEPDLALSLSGADTSKPSAVDTETIAMPLADEEREQKFSVGLAADDYSYADLVARLVHMPRFTLKEAANIVLPRVQKPSKRAIDVMRQALYRDDRFAHEIGDDGRAYFWRTNGRATTVDEPVVNHDHEK